MIQSMSESIDATLTLVRRAQEGDQVALGNLFARYYGPVRAYVRRRLGRELRLEVDSVDIMQETFLIAVERFDRFEVRNDASLINWLSTIAENRIRALARRAFAEKRDRRRQKALRLLRDSIAVGEVRVDPVANITLPPEVCERAEMKELLYEALDGLKPEFRDVILHRTYAKASWAEIAELLGKGSEGAARQLHARAMVQLATRMGGDSPT